MDVEVDVVKLVPCLIKINYETGHLDEHETGPKQHLENGRLESLMSYQLPELMNLKEATNTKRRFSLQPQKCLH
jgi:hypothetical protein